MYLGGLFTLIFYDKLNKISSFKTQIKWYPIIVGLCFPVLYLASWIHTEKQGFGLISLKTIIFLAIVVCISCINTILFVSAFL